MATLDTLIVFDALSSRPPESSHPQIAIRNSHAVLAFGEAADQSTDFLGVLPANYAGGGLDIRVAWSSATATSGGVRWSAAAERHAIADPVHGTVDLDTDNFGASVEVDSIAPPASGELVQATLTLSPSQIADAQASESFRLRISRVGSHSSDTMVGDAQVLLIEVREA